MTLHPRVSTGSLGCFSLSFFNPLPMQAAHARTPSPPLNQKSTKNTIMNQSLPCMPPNMSEDKFFVHSLSHGLTTSMPTGSPLPSSDKQDMLHVFFDNPGEPGHGASSGIGDIPVGVSYQVVANSHILQGLMNPPTKLTRNER